jgi:hypothetical protein
MKDIILERDVETASYEALMDIGIFKDDYRFILPVLALSEEGGVTGELVNTRLFGVDGNDPRGRRLLEVMVGYRLIWKGSVKEETAGSHYRLTERGQRIKEIFQKSQYDRIDPELLAKLLDLNIIRSDSNSGFSIFRNRSYGLSPLGVRIFSGENLSEDDPGVFSELEKLGIIRGQSLKNISYNGRYDEIDTDSFSEIMDRLEDSDKNTCTSQYELTDTGRIALQEGQVPVPEKGVFVLTGTTDPLFCEPVLACRPKEAGKEKGQEFERIAYLSPKNRKEPEKNNISGKKRPKWLEDLRRSTRSSPKVLTLAAQNREVIQVVDIDENANPSQMKEKVSASLRISSNSTPEMTVVSRAGKAAAETKFNLPFMEVMTSLFPEIEEDIVEYEGAPALLVSYEEIKNDPSEVNTMQRTVTVHAPEIQGFGRFKDVEISGLPLLPRSLEDAGSWARDRVFDGITTYIDKHSYDALCEKEAARFSKRFEPETVRSSLPTFREIRTIMEEKREKDPKKYWFVTAPVVLTFREGM